MTQASDRTATEGERQARLAYEQLPQAIRTGLGFRSWLFLPDSEKARLYERETTPDWIGLDP